MFLIIVCYLGYLDIVKIFIENKVDINKLIEYGVDVN